MPELIKSTDLWNDHSAIIWVIKMACSAFIFNCVSLYKASPANKVKFPRVFTIYSFSKSLNRQAQAP